MVVEHLFSSDRNSLLSEIQDLRAQLRMTHLQNQEKLQQLQETLTKAEDHGSKQEHCLRRKGSNPKFLLSGLLCQFFPFLPRRLKKKKKRLFCKEAVQFLSFTNALRFPTSLAEEGIILLCNI